VQEIESRRISFDCRDESTGRWSRHDEAGIGSRRFTRKCGRELPIDRVEVCYDSGSRRGRKRIPQTKTGMLLRAAHDLNIDLAQSWMVGDRWRDIDCGVRAGCKTVLIDRHYTEALKQKPDFFCWQFGRSRRHYPPRIKNNLIMRTLKDLKIKIFADGADKKGMLELNANPLIQGLTTNPTLHAQVGITDFEAFARDILQSVTVKRAIRSKFVFDEFSEMKRQAIKINGWAKKCLCQIPITNTRGESSCRCE